MGIERPRRHGTPRSERLPAPGPRRALTGQRDHPESQDLDVTCPACGGMLVDVAPGATRCACGRRHSPEPTRPEPDECWCHRSAVTRCAGCSTRLCSTHAVRRASGEILCHGCAPAPATAWNYLTAESELRRMFAELTDHLATARQPDAVLEHTVAYGHPKPTADPPAPPEPPERYRSASGLFALHPGADCPLHGTACRVARVHRWGLRPTTHGGAAICRMAIWQVFQLDVFDEHAPAFGVNRAAGVVSTARMWRPAPLVTDAADVGAADIDVWDGASEGARALLLRASGRGIDYTTMVEAVRFRFGL